MKKILLIALILSVTNNFSQESRWELKNLSINDGHSNLGATFYGSDKIVFSSAVGGKLHLYSGAITNDDVINKTSFLEAKTQESITTFTNDLKTMYFTKSLYGTENTIKSNRDKKAKLAIFKATKNGSGWGNITELNLGNKKYDFAHPALSSDNTKLYFSSNMKGTRGKSDIFVVDILGDGKYSVPRNLGKSVNTKGSELYPFISSDNTLYFSSNGHKGLGGLDIYGVNINNMSQLRQLQEPINSRDDDFAYIYNSAKKRGFFSSNRVGGKGSDDIYLFIEKEKEEEKEIAKIKKKKGCNQKLLGTVYLNASQKVISHAVVNLKDETEKIIATFKTNESGRFVFEVKCGRSYKLIGTRQKYKTSERLMVTNAQDGIIARKNIFLTTEKAEGEGKKKREYIGRVDFEYNKTNLLRRYRYQLDKAILKMKKNPKLIIHFESHTDSRAPTDFNKELSEARIEVLKEYIGFKGIFRKRFSGEAYGETKPLNKCKKGFECTEEEHLLNRRTTFVLIEKK